MSQAPPASFTEGPIRNHVLRLGGFMVLGFLAMTVAQLIEAVYLGILGTAELAAVAFGFPLVMALGAATRGIGIGIGAILARAMGAGRRDQAHQLASHGLLLASGFTIICALLVAVNARSMFSLMGAEGEILELALAYMHIWCLGFPAFGLTMVSSGLMRSFRAAAYPGYVMAFGSLLQVLLGPILIFGWFDTPALGIEGAAWAFVLARTASLLLCLHWFVIRERMLSASLAGMVKNARAIAHVGGPAMASNLIAPITAAITTWILAAGLMWVGAPRIIAWISSESRVLVTAIAYLYIVPLSLGFVGMLNAASGSFNALSRPGPPLILALVRLFVIYTPAAIIAGRIWGASGVFVVTALANIIMGLWAWLWNRRTLVALVGVRGS